MTFWGEGDDASVMFATGDLPFSRAAKVQTVVNPSFVGEAGVRTVAHAFKRGKNAMRDRVSLL
jgi:hypothetical protein